MEPGWKQEVLSRSPSSRLVRRLACEPPAWTAGGDGIGGHCGPNTAEVSGSLASDHCERGRKLVTSFG